MKRLILILSKNLNPSQILVLGYLVMILVGYALLSLPFMQSASVSSMDHFFTAASAASTTGLASINVGSTYSIFGKVVILIIIQFGGIGYMSIASFIVLGGRKKLSKFTSTLLQKDFDLSDQYNLVDFVKSIIWFSLAFEIFGTLSLYSVFSSQGVDQPLWNALFHSVSAFCTAGFSLFPNSFEDFSGHFGLNLIITILSLAGCVGFIVFADLYQKFTGKKDTITFTSKIILRFTFWSFVTGSFLMFISQSQLSSEVLENQWMISIFQTMTAVTTVGFNTWPIDQLSNALILLIIILMLVGASPAGTGGGIKSTTISAMYAVTVCALREKEHTTFLRNKIPFNRIRMAVANFFFYFMIVGLGIFLLMLTEDLPAFSLIFEATSALGTVGLSTGITGELSTMGKVVIIFLMFLGRIGALTFGLSILKKEETEDIEPDDSDVVI